MFAKLFEVKPAVHTATSEREGGMKKRETPSQVFGGTERNKKVGFNEASR